MSVTIVGEPGCTAEGDLDAMLALIDLAAEAELDAVKFQWVSDPRRLIDRRVQYGFADDPEGRRAAIETYERYYGWLAFPEAWHATLRDRCAHHGLRHACTAYLPEDVATIAPYVSAIKIASFEASDRALLDAALETDCDVWVSTGMLGQNGIQRLQRAWTAAQGDLVIFQCTSSYPCPLDALNLAVIRDEYGITGFSDHASPYEAWTGALAVAAGAEIVETHYRSYVAKDDNPDTAVAKTPHTLRAYVSAIRYAERCLGDGYKQPQACEAAMSRYRVVT